MVERGCAGGRDCGGLCADTNVTSGIFIAPLNLNQSVPPPIVSISYGGCEAEDGAVATKYING